MLSYFTKEKFFMNYYNEPFDYQVLHLSKKFYTDYPNPPYRELVIKEARPYNCLLIQSSYDYFICIPYRSHINHKYTYRFKHSERSRKNKSGLDYTKIVIIKNLDYIGENDAVIDSDEYKETRENILYIKNDAQEYINNYIEYKLGNSEKYNEKAFNRIYGYSTLQYFHNELGIE